LFGEQPKKPTHSQLQRAPATRLPSGGRLPLREAFQTGHEWLGKAQNGSFSMAKPSVPINTAHFAGKNRKISGYC